MHGGTKLTVIASTFTNNQGIPGIPAPGGIAGAMVLFGDTDIQYSTFISNTAVSDAGAIKIVGDDQDPTIVNITNSSFSQNQAGGKGGAIEITGGKLAPVTLTGGSFNNNQAQDGGAIFAVVGSLTLNGVTLNNNAALTPQTAGGGAIFSANVLNLQGDTFTGNYVDPNGGPDPSVATLGGGAVFISNTATINNSTFQGNQARNDENYEGGAIVNLGTLILTQSRLINNQAGQSGQWTAGGAISNLGQLNGSLSIFQQNQAGCGGALYNGGVLNLTDSTFGANRGYT